MAIDNALNITSETDVCVKDAGEFIVLHPSLFKQPLNIISWSFKEMLKEKKQKSNWHNILTGLHAALCVLMFTLNFFWLSNCSTALISRHDSGPVALLCLFAAIHPGSSLH